MNIDTLRIFIDVAHRLSFKAVAEDKDIDPSSVSRTINNLEDQLGIRLFNRTTRKVTLTEAGEIYLKGIINVIENYDYTEEQARSIRHQPRGPLRLTTSVAFGERMLIPLVTQFNQDYPDVKLELLLTDDNLDLVSNGIDLAIRLAPNVSGDLVATKLMPTTYKVVASQHYIKSHPSIDHPEDLQHHHCTVFSLPAYRNEWRFIQKDDQQQNEQSIQIRTGNVISSALSIRSLVKQGSGPALLADWLVNQDIEQGDLIDLFPTYNVTATKFDTAAWLVYPNRTHLPIKVRVMIDFLKAHLKYA